MTTATEAQQRERKHALANRQQIKLLRALLAEDAGRSGDLTDPEPADQDSDPEAAPVVDGRRTRV